MKVIMNLFQSNNKEDRATSIDIVLLSLLSALNTFRTPQQAFTYSKSTTKTKELRVKSVQSKQ